MPDLAATLILTGLHSLGYLLVCLWLNHRRWRAIDRELSFTDSLLRFMKLRAAWRQNFRYTAISVLALFGVTIMDVNAVEDEEPQDRSD